MLIRCNEDNNIDYNDNGDTDDNDHGNDDNDDGNGDATFLFISTPLEPQKQPTQRSPLDI